MLRRFTNKAVAPYTPKPNSSRRRVKTATSFVGYVLQFEAPKPNSSRRRVKTSRLLPTESQIFSPPKPNSSRRRVKTEPLKIVNLLVAGPEAKFQ